MKKLLLPLLTTALLLVGCSSYSNTLFIDKVSPPSHAFTMGQRVYRGILTPYLFDKAMKYLTYSSNKPTQMVTLSGNVYSYEEYAFRMKLKMPNISNIFIVTSGDILGGMDYKDVWLSKGAPLAVFVAGEIVTWRYKNDDLVIFFQGKSTVR